MGMFAERATLACEPCRSSQEDRRGTAVGAPFADSPGPGHRRASPCIISRRVKRRLGSGLWNGGEPMRRFHPFWMALTAIGLVVGTARSQDSSGMAPYFLAYRLVLQRYEAPGMEANTLKLLHLRAVSSGGLSGIKSPPRTAATKRRQSAQSRAETGIAWGFAPETFAAL